MRNKFRSITLLTSFLLSIPHFSSAVSLDIEKRVIEHTFKNGLKVLMMERHQSATVTAFIRMNVGSVDEVTGNTGIAHMLEHMLFKGTKTLGTIDYKKEKPILDEIDKVAAALDAENRKGVRMDKAKAGELKSKLKELQSKHKPFVVPDEFSQLYAKNGGVGHNAGTGNDGTTYMIHLPANKLELWAAIESDRMRDPVLREFYAERDVVMEERRMRIENSAGGKLYEQFISAAFTAHPYGVPIIGWPSDIKNLSKAETKKFLKTYYSPNNAIMGIVGDINPDEIIKLIEKYFGDIPSQPKPPPVLTVEPQQAGKRRVELLHDSEPQLLMGYHKPTLPDHDDYVFDVIDSILSSGRTSRLYKSIVLKKQLATDVGTYSAPGSRYSNLFVFSGKPRHPHTVQELEQAIEEEIEKLKTQPVKKEELQKVVNQMEAGLVRGLNSNSGMASKLIYYEAIAGDWKYFLTHIDKIKEITTEDIMKTARKYLVNQNKTVAYIKKKQ
jgi:predicted Zn-dependent peptidase